MSCRGKLRLVVAGVIVGLVLAPATAGASCPQGTGQSCEKVGPRPDGVLGTGEQQRVRLAPRVLERDGQTVWRAGNHLMH